MDARLLLAAGFDPTRNQSEFGAPMVSCWGQKLRRMRKPPVPTILPGPYHFTNQVGTVSVGSYATSATVLADVGFSGEVPLSESPVIVRGAPWVR